MSQVDINLSVSYGKLQRSQRTQHGQNKNIKLNAHLRKNYMLLKPESAGICLCKHSINQDKINNLMTVGNKGIELRVQKIKNSVIACSSFL